MIKEGSFVKVVKKRDYDFMEEVYLQVLKVDNLRENKNGETYLDLIADDYLISKDSYLRYKEVIGFLLSEVEEADEADIQQGRLDNIDYKENKILQQIGFLESELSDLYDSKNEMFTHENKFIRDAPLKTWIESLS